jgi:tetratricopeptide (TPR) repeat protein
MAPEVLESLLVGRERLAERIMRTIRDAASGRARRHLLLIGPHGIGKTHLISLIHHHIQSAGELRDRLVIAWLREDEWGVTSFLDVLLRILRALPAEGLSAALAERVEGLYRVPSEVAEQAAGALLWEVVGDKTLLVMVENLDDVFKGLGPDGQEHFRRYLDDHPFCLFLATAQSVFDGVTGSEAPFRGFFAIHQMDELTPENAARLVTNIAALKVDYKLESFLQTPRGEARIRAAHHLAGGNHRIWVIFSQFLTRDSLNALHEPLTRALDDLTPYYHARMAWISPQQRKVVEFLCERRAAVPVREIAQHCFMTHQTASGQLKTLREMRYVRAESVGRNSYYELREPLMRLSLDVKSHRGEPVRLLVEFLRLWFADQDSPFCALLDVPDWRYGGASIAPPAGRQRIEAYSKDLELHALAGDFERALVIANELVSIRGKAQDWYARGYCLTRLGHELSALSSFAHATSLDPNCPQVWAGKGWALWQLGRYHKALAAFQRAMDQSPGDPAVTSNFGVVLCQLGRHREAAEVFDRLRAACPNDLRPWIGRALAMNGLGNSLEALNACEKALASEARSPAILWIRAESLLALRRWEEASPALAEALADVTAPMEDLLTPTKRIVRHLFENSQDMAELKRRIRTIIGLYENRGALPALGQGVVKNIPALMSPRVSDLQAEEWFAIWRELAGDRLEFQIPVRFLAAAVRYRSSRDPRILLEQQVEYRTLLAPLLAPERSAET